MQPAVTGDGRTPDAFSFVARPAYVRTAPYFALPIALSFVAPVFVDNQYMRSRRGLAKWMRTNGLFRLFRHLFSSLNRGCEALANRLVNLSPMRLEERTAGGCTQTLSAASAAFSVVVLDTIGDTCSHLVDVG